MNLNTVKKNYKDWLFVLSILIWPLILFCVFYIGINAGSIAMAFENISYTGERSWAAFDNFKSFFKLLSNDSDTLLKVSFINSLKMYIICLVICMPLYIFFSYLLFKKVKGHSVIRVITMLPQIISGMVIGIVFKSFVKEALPSIVEGLGWCEAGKFPNLLRDSRYMFGTTVFFSIWISFSTSLVVYPNAMSGIDPEVIESAQIDGIDNMFQELWYIILPLIYPTVSTFLITGFAGILSNAGALIEFYQYAAPAEVYNVGYYYTVKVVAVSNEMGYPVLAAGGIVMTLIVAPLTNLLKCALEKFGPETEAR